MIKQILTTIGVSALLATANAQTNTTNTVTTGLGEPADKIIQFLSVGSNWMVAPYGIIGHDAEGNSTAGGGIGAFYKLNEYAATGLRLDYLDGSLWMPSANFQLQLPLKLAGKIEVIPFAITGIASPLSGKGADNGSAVGIFGAGLAARISKHWDIVYDIEKWTSFQGAQHRFGALYKF